MKRLRYAIAALVPLVLMPLATVPSHAALQGFEVLDVTATGCTTGTFQMQVDRRLMGESLTVRTAVIGADGLWYMNEAASISGDGQTTWALFDIETYVPPGQAKKGTWPIPSDMQLRINFTLERARGDVLSAWTLVVDGCNTGNILYNDETFKDTDRDLVPTPADLCPLVAEEDADGCPTVGRSLTLSYAKGKKRFSGVLTAAAAPGLQSGQRVQVMQRRKGPDRTVATTTTKANGSYAAKKKAAPGRYYAKVAQAVDPEIGLANAKKSPKITVKR